MISSGAPSNSFGSGLGTLAFAKKKISGSHPSPRSKTNDCVAGAENEPKPFTARVEPQKAPNERDGVIMFHGRG